VAPWWKYMPSAPALKRAGDPDLCPASRQSVERVPHQHCGFYPRTFSANPLGQKRCSPPSGSRAPCKHPIRHMRVPHSARAGLPLLTHII